MEPIRRVTAPTVAVLRVLLDSSESVWGLKIAKLTGYAPGSVYPILARLEDSRWLVAEWDDNNGRVGARRRLYSLTQEGESYAARTVASWESRTARIHVSSAGTVQA